MNSTSRTKPVMDIAAPKSPALASAPSSVATLASRPARSPLRSMLSQRALSQAAPTPANHDQPLREQRVAAPAVAHHHTPVALITVTVFVVLVLSALAVTVYVTSRTA